MADTQTPSSSSEAEAEAEVPEYNDVCLPLFAPPQYCLDLSRDADKKIRYWVLGCYDNFD
jgi:hypothetical protein